MSINWNDDEKHTVNLPLRVNWGGGWSDTPPICCEMGGTVLNAAISLNGELPVEVTLIKIPEKKIVFDSTNTLIDQIFLSIEDLIDAKMVCGAGGGGFLQVILKKGVQKADVHKRLKDVFQDNPVDVWDCEII